MRIDHNQPEYLAAMALYLTGDRNEAKKGFEELIKKNPQDSSLLLLLGNIKYSIGELREACLDYENAIALEPGFDQANYKLGVCYVRMGKLTEALGCFQKNIKKPSQGHVMSYYWMGLINSFLGNDEDAFVAFQRLHQESDESRLADFFLAQLYMKRNEHGKALELLEDLLKETPGFAEVHYLMGLAYGVLHRNAEAILKFRQALAINPEDKRARVQLELYTEVPSI